MQPKERRLDVSPCGALQAVGRPLVAVFARETSGLWATDKRSLHAPRQHRPESVEDPRKEDKSISAPPAASSRRGGAE